MNDINKLKVAVEDLGYNIEHSLDLLQLIEEDVEGEFFHESVSPTVRARAGIVLSAMYIPYDNIKDLSRRAKELANGTPEA